MLLLGWGGLWVPRHWRSAAAPRLLLHGLLSLLLQLLLLLQNELPGFGLHPREGRGHMRAGGVRCCTATAAASASASAAACPDLV